MFGLPRRFALDRDELDARRRALQAQVHPDRFAAAGAASQRLAMQWAVRVNEAHERLKDPIRRAAYLCELGGEPIDAENNTAMPPEFLSRQMALRDALDEASTRADVESLARALAEERGQAHERLAHTLDEAHDVAGAAAQVRALMFIERFAGDVEARLAAFDS